LDGVLSASRAALCVVDERIRDRGRIAEVRPAGRLWNGAVPVPIRTCRATLSDPGPMWVGSRVVGPY
jgi:hypothetical protein